MAISAFEYTRMLDSNKFFKYEHIYCPTKESTSISSKQRRFRLVRSFIGLSSFSQTIQLQLDWFLGDGRPEAIPHKIRENLTNSTRIYMQLSTLLSNGCNVRADKVAMKLSMPWGLPRLYWKRMFCRNLMQLNRYLWSAIWESRAESNKTLDFS